MQFDLFVKLFRLIKSKISITQQVTPMQKVYTVYDDRPISYNASTNSKKRYQTAIRDKFIINYKKHYSNLPLTTTLESRIIYSSRVQLVKDRADINNISKPTIDAFVGCIYNDDKQIIQRIATRYDLSPLKTISIDCSDMPFEVANDINQCLLSKSEHHLFALLP